jgi:heat shock protein HtpX
LDSVKSDDVKQLFIEHKSSLMGMFATHPPIEKRIAVLEQM